MIPALPAALLSRQQQDSAELSTPGLGRVRFAGNLRRTSSSPVRGPGLREFAHCLGGRGIALLDGAEDSSNVGHGRSFQRDAGTHDYSDPLTQPPPGALLRRVPDVTPSRVSKYLGFPAQPPQRWASRITPCPGVRYCHLVNQDPGKRVFTLIYGALASHFAVPSRREVFPVRGVPLIVQQHRCPPARRRRSSACSALPSRPHPPLHRIDYLLRRDVIQVAGRCGNAGVPQLLGDDADIDPLSP